MGTISSTGLISGLDTRSIIDQLMAIEARPKSLVEQYLAELTTKKTAFLDLNARLLALQGSATSFLDDSVFGAYKATSSNTSILTASASTDAKPGNYAMTVHQLVSNHQMITRGFSDSDTTPVGAGDITIESAAGKLTRTVMLSELNGMAGVERGTIRITDRSGATADVDLSTAINLDDVVEAINNAGTINVTAAMTGDNLTLTDQTGLTTSNLIVASLSGRTTAEDLGIAGNSAGTDTLTGTAINTISTDTVLGLLNDGNGVRTSSGVTDLTINDHAGNAVEVNLDGAATLEDVIEKINDAATAAGSSVAASISTDGVSLTLTDSSAYVGNELSVDVSDAATDLGFIQADSDHDGELVGERLVASLGSKLLKSLNGGSGVSMDQAYGPSELTTSTLLDDLFDGAGLSTHATNDDFAIRARDNQFVVYSIEVDGLTTAQDLIDAVDTATGGKVTLSIEGRAFRATDHTGGTNNLRIYDIYSASTVAESLGLEINDAVDTVLGVDTYPVPQPTTGYGPGQIRITTRDGTINDVDLNSARSIYDVIQTINDAGIGVTASLNSAGNGLLLTDTTGGTNDLIVGEIGGGALAAELGLLGTYSANTADSGDLDVQYISLSTRLEDLNGGGGITRGSFTLTDSNGVSATVDLSQGNEVTLADVVAEINSRATSITASLNTTGDGLLLTDTGGGAARMKVEEAGATTAADLGILGEDTDDDDRIDGAFETTITLDVDDTLDDLVNAINSADAGVSATLINDGSAAPYRISLTSDSTGAAGEMLLDDGGLGLEVETLVKPSDAVVFFGSSDPTQSILLTNSTNVLTDTIEGVSIDLVGTSSEAVTLSVTRDTEAAVDAVNQFVTRFNDAMSRVNALDSYNSDTEERGVLLGDPTVAAIKRSLINLITREYDDVTDQYTYLREVGLTIGADAKLVFDETAFRDALANDPEAVAELFALQTQAAAEDEEIVPGVTIPGSITTTARGFGATLEALVEGYTDTIDGRLTTATNGIDTQIEIGNERIEYLDALLDSKRSRLEAQFLAMEQALAVIQNQQSAISSLASLALNTGNS